MATSAPRKSTSKPKPVFDLAQAEKEFADSERPEPFTVNVSEDELVTFADPNDLDWQVVATMLTSNDPFLFLRSVIEDDGEFKAFMKRKIPNAVVNEMMTAYKDHYALNLSRGN